MSEQKEHEFWWNPKRLHDRRNEIPRFPNIDTSALESDINSLSGNTTTIINNITALSGNTMQLLGGYARLTGSTTEGRENIFSDIINVYKPAMDGWSLVKVGDYGEITIDTKKSNIICISAATSVNVTKIIGLTNGSKATFINVSNNTNYIFFRHDSGEITPVGNGSIVVNYNNPGGSPYVTLRGGDYNGVDVIAYNNKIYVANYPFSEINDLGTHMDNLYHNIIDDVTWIYVGAGDAPAFENSFNNYDTSYYTSLRYNKDIFGWVTIRGIISTNNSFGPGAVIFTLPSGYVPINKMDKYPVLAVDGAHYTGMGCAEVMSIGSGGPGRVRLYMTGLVNSHGDTWNSNSNLSYAIDIRYKLID